MKPTRARNPAGPDVGEGWAGMSTAHALSRSVRDSAALLDATHGADLGAPYWAPPTDRSYLHEVGAEVGALRIAVQTRTFNGVPTHDDCVSGAQDAAELCRSLGHEVEAVDLPIDFEPVRAAAGTIIAANLRATLEKRAAQLGRPIGEDDVEPVTHAMIKNISASSAADYAAAIPVIHGAGREVERFLQKYDVLLTPTMAAPPAKIGVLALDNPDFGAFAASVMSAVGFTQLFNASGHPAMSVPLSWNADGLPIGIQFAGRFGDEATLFRLAAQLEVARPWFDKRPPR
jgi:Asp-tRNA(Asn)/Glu-tRNA(Gln) amidotransferase A subunit family amidase